MPADRVPLKTIRLRMTASPRSRCSQIQRPHSNIARLVIQCSQCPRVITEAAPGYNSKWFAVDGSGFGSDLAALTSAYEYL
jgi:hypothetical protein